MSLLAMYSWQVSFIYYMTDPDEEHRMELIIGDCMAWSEMGVQWISSLHLSFHQ